MSCPDAQEKVGTFPEGDLHVWADRIAALGGPDGGGAARLREHLAKMQGRVNIDTVFDMLSRREDMWYDDWIAIAAHDGRFAEALLVVLEAMGPHCVLFTREHMSWNLGYLARLAIWNPCFKGYASSMVHNVEISQGRPHFIWWTLGEDATDEEIQWGIEAVKSMPQTVYVCCDVPHEPSERLSEVERYIAGRAGAATGARTGTKRRQSMVSTIQGVRVKRARRVD